MTEHVVECSFSDFRTVKGRKVAQLILEIPIEAADHALSVLGGVPRPDADRWCALVRLDKAAASAGVNSVPKPQDDAHKEKSEGEKAVARAGILCNDPDFQRWVIQAAPHSARDNAQGFGTADILRAWLGVTTRKALATDADVLERFQRIDEAFKRDATTKRYQGIRT